MVEIVEPEGFKSVDAGIRFFCFDSVIVVMTNEEVLRTDFTCLLWE